MFKAKIVTAYYEVKGNNKMQKEEKYYCSKIVT